MSSRSKRIKLAASAVGMLTAATLALGTAPASASGTYSGLAHVHGAGDYSRLTPAQGHQLLHRPQGAGTNGAMVTPNATPDVGVPYQLDASFSNVTVNAGKPIVVGTTNLVNARINYTVTHGTDVDLAASDVYFGTDLYSGTLDNETNTLWPKTLPTCSIVSDTVANCTDTVVINPRADLSNTDAGFHWKAEGYAFDFNGQDPTDPNLDLSRVGFADQGDLASTGLKRYSKLTVNAGPEPVSKYKTVTVVGKLSRANWDTNTYAGYTYQYVKLQFRKAGTSTYSTLKTTRSNSTGYLKTTWTAHYDGYWRYSFAGTSTTPAVNAVGDYVNVL